MRLVALVALAMLVAGCSGSAWTVKKDVALGQGDFSEINLNLKAGDKISWDWHTDGGKKAHFNVHTHRSGVTAEIVKMDATSSKDSYTAEDSGEYSLLWENTLPQALTIHYKASGDGTLSGVV